MATSISLIAPLNRNCRSHNNMAFGASDRKGKTKHMTLKPTVVTARLPNRATQPLARDRPTSTPIDSPRSTIPSSASLNDSFVWSAGIRETQVPDKAPFTINGFLGEGQL
ncbi:MAG: hypothetical protein ACI9R3_005169 [Verrucomicrobiales bacterium]|jgi:hypothetical protein